MPSQLVRGKFAVAPTRSVTQKPHLTTAHVNSVPAAARDEPELCVRCWEKLARPASCRQARNSPLFKAAASGSSCCHTESVSTTCLPRSRDYYCRRTSLTFSKIETESSVLFTENNQDCIGPRCASGFGARKSRLPSRHGPEPNR